MKADETSALIALLREPRPGVPPTAADIERSGGPRAALDATAGLFADEAQRHGLALFSAWAEAGITPVAYFDERYPAQLSGIQDAPALLFIRGHLTAGDRNGVAVIGTRAPSAVGLRVANQLADALVQAKRTVFSGLAAGIDTAAHTAALAAGGRSIAVLGTGLQHVYPPANAALQRRLPVLISQFWPEQGPRRENFPLRNALMSAVSSATVIVEAGTRSGSRIQARHAIVQGRPLVLMASLLAHEWAKTLASRAGVRVIGTPDELLGALDSWTV